MTGVVSIGNVSYKDDICLVTCQKHYIAVFG